MSARRASVTGNARRLRDRVGHQPGQRALAQLPGEEPADEARLRLGRALEQRAEDLARAVSAEPLPGRVLDRA